MTALFPQNAGKALPLPHLPTISGSSTLWLGDFCINDLGMLVDYRGKANELIVPTSINGARVRHLGDQLFQNEASVTRVTVPAGAYSIGANTFAECAALREIVLPDSLQAIGANAFLGARSLESITIPANVTFVGSGAFASCDALGEIIVAPGNSCYASVGGALIDRTGLPVAVAGIPDSGDYAVPHGVSAIGASAFSGMENLRRVIISEGVLSIGSNAFSGCSHLESITIPKSCTSIDLTGVARSVTLIVAPGSAAEVYAMSRGFPYEYILH